jgi:hypothetical protein
MSYRNHARDQQTADAATAFDPLHCPAHGCPHRWAVEGDRGRACSAHYWADRQAWPAITEQLQRDEADRAMRRMVPPRTPTPTTREQRRATVEALHQLGNGPADPRAWARRLRDRHERGDRLTRDEIDAFRRALPEDQEFTP